MEIIQILTNGGREVKEITANNYVRNVTRIVKAIDASFNITNITTEDIFLLWNTHKENIKKYIDKQAISTKLQLISALIVFLSPHGRYRWKNTAHKNAGEELGDLLKKTHKEYYDFLDTRELTQQQEKNWTDWDKLVNIWKKYKNKIRSLGYKNKSKELKRASHGELIQKYLVASLYLLHPPRRLEYADVQICSYDEYQKKEKKDRNYLVYGTKTTNYPSHSNRNRGRNKKFFHFGDYKTSKKYGIQIIPVQPKLNSAINLWLNVRDINSCEYLLCNQNGTKMTKNNLTKFIQRTFQDTGKSISCSLLRNIFLTNKFKDETSWKNKKDLAYQMGHSVQVQQSVYVKNVKS